MMVEPSIEDVVNSVLGSSRISGISSESSNNFREQFCVTRLAGVGARPGPKTKSLDAAVG